MTVGSVFSEALALYRRFFARFFLTAAAVFVVVNLIAALAEDVRADADDAVAFFWGVLALVAMLVGSLWLQGALTATVADVREGRADDDIESTFKRVRPYLGTLLVAGLIAGAGIALGTLAFIVPGLFLLTRWIVVTPAVVLEGLSATDALRRSWSLVRGRSWQVFAVILSTLLIALVAHTMFVLLFVFLPTFFQTWLGGLVANSLVTPFVVLCWTLLYFRLRGDPAPSPAAAS